MTAHLKTPFANSLMQVARAEAANAIEKLGKALPCTVVSVQGALVTVSFEVQSDFTLPQVQMPVAEWAYARMPVQVGDKGVTRPATTYIGGVSGLGGGVADLSIRGNLSTLIFEPVSNANWPAVDPNAVVLKGVGSSGVVLSSGDGNCVLTLNASGFTLTIGGNEVAAFSASGLVVTNGDVKADTISLKDHLTSDVQGGSGKSGPPVAS